MARRFPIAFPKVFLPCYPCRQLQRVIKFETWERTFFEPMDPPVPLRLFFKSGFSLGEGVPLPRPRLQAVHGTVPHRLVGNWLRTTIHRMT